MAVSETKMNQIYMLLLPRHELSLAKQAKQMVLYKPKQKKTFMLSTNTAYLPLCSFQQVKNLLQVSQWCLMPYVTHLKYKISYIEKL